MKVHFIALKKKAIFAAVSAVSLFLSFVALARDDRAAGGGSPEDAAAKNFIARAVRKLADASGYRWTTTIAARDSAPFARAGGDSGSTEKGGFTHAAISSATGTREFVTKAGKTAVLVDGNWRKLEPPAAQVGRASANPAAADFRTISDFKLPAARALELIGMGASCRREGNTVTVTLSPDVAGKLLEAEFPAPRRRGGGGQTEVPIKDPKATVVFQIEEGILNEFTLNLSGSRKIFDNEVKLDRSKTTKIAATGSTKVETADDAREIVEAMIAGVESNVFTPEPGFRKLFDGRTLSGWEGRPGFWSVEDRAIVGRTTKDNPLKRNTFLFAKANGKNMIVNDFELRLSYRITADNDTGFANSGIQYRSKDKGDFVAAGYQADMEAGSKFSGVLYDEAGGAGGRGVMAQRGEKVTWTSDGKKRVNGRLGSSEEIQAKIKKDDWNEYIVITRGNHIQHFINGVLTVDVFDDSAKRLDSGVLALQLHAGRPMTVRFKDIRIKSLRSAAESAIADVRIAKGFRLDLMYSVPRETQGSWVALCSDPKGRLITADQSGKLYRSTLPAPGESGSIEPEAIGVDLAGAHGLLYAFDSLYVMVNERGTHGLYRVRDTDGDDRYDEVKLLREIRGGGEHGMHSIVLSPDGKSLYVVCGNSTELTKVDSSRVPLNWGEDNLACRIPTGFMDNSLAPQGWIARTDRDGKEWELIAAGMRNPFDIAFNHDGELFTYDADMEWDIGEPWYRPTRVNHVIAGAEFGFRNGSGKWPSYFIDSFGSVVDIGPGSPTGITFGYGAKFPEKYRNALFISDWSFGKLRAVHLKPEGASYTAEVEDFLSGQPLPITDVIIHPHDGAMYLTVGGRGAQSALYRVTYVGIESASSVSPAISASVASSSAARRALRRSLEAYQGRKDKAAVQAVWPYLGDHERAIRYAARVALEWQDPAEWSEKALRETDPRKAIAALVALARVSGKDEPHRKPTDPAPDPATRGRILAALDAIDWSRLDRADRIDLLRAYSLTFIRLGRPGEDECRRSAAKFDALFPSRAAEVDYLLAEILSYLQAPTAATKVMKALRESTTQEAQIQYALVLRGLKAGWTPELREEYFRWFAETASTYRGGNTFASSLRTIKSQAIESLSEAEKGALKPILDAQPSGKSPRELLAARKSIREWALDDLIPVVERGLRERRDLDRGRRLYGIAACAVCHRFGNEGGGVGPDLTAVAGRFNVRDLLEAIVEPSKVISDQYGAVSIAKKDGRVVTGRVGNLSGNSLNVIEDMFDPGRSTNVRREDIEEIQPSKVSPMPAGLLNSLTEDEILDLVAYLLARGEPRDK